MLVICVAFTSGETVMRTYTEQELSAIVPTPLAPLQRVLTRVQRGVAGTEMNGWEEWFPVN
jgi:hypothetical protein